MFRICINLDIKALFVIVVVELGIENQIKSSLKLETKINVCLMTTQPIRSKVECEVVVVISAVFDYYK